MKLPLAIPSLLLIAFLAPNAAACQQAIVLTAEHDRVQVHLHWNTLPGPVQADSWIVEVTVDGGEPEDIVLPGDATEYYDSTNEALIDTLYRVYYMVDGDRSQPSNVVVLVYPRCDIIQGISVHPDCLFPLPP